MQDDNLLYYELGADAKPKPNFNANKGGSQNFNRGGGGGGKEGESFHGTPLIISWLLIIDLAVLIAAIRWNKYTYYIHTLFGLTVIGLTLGATIPLLMDEFIFKDRQKVLQKTHRLVGFMVVVWMGIQGLTGIFSRVIQYSGKVGPSLCKWIKRIHSISGYSLMLLAKFNYLNMEWNNSNPKNQFYLYIAADVVVILLYLWVKFAYWTLSQQIVDNQVLAKKAQPKQISEVHQGEQIQQPDPQVLETGRPMAGEQVKDKIDQTTDQDKQNLKNPQIIGIQTVFRSQNLIPLEKYVLFNDFVYDISKFKEYHPGGEQIIELMNKRQINRFMYGSYSAQLTPNVSPHDHSQGSMKLCGAPVAKVHRFSPITGLNDYNRVSIYHKSPIKTLSQTYLVYLKPMRSSLKFEGFESQRQIGQYFSLTISNNNGRSRVTRLYTTIWCTRPQNIKFMKFLISDFNNQSLVKIENDQIELNDANLQTNDNINYSKQAIPLVIKRYQKGKLTPRLLKDDFNGEILISKPLGCGMKYDSLQQSGKIIIVCGGTGLLPFCDFIDLLFKRVKYLQGRNYSVDLEKNDPLVASNLIRKRQFKVYCATQNSKDILNLSLHQINYLCNSQDIKFECIFRIKRDEQAFLGKYKGIKGQKGYFNENIQSDIKSGNICQIYVCGSPQMNFSIGKLLKQKEVSEQLYHFM